MARTEAGLANRVSGNPSRTLWQILRANLLTLFNAIVGCSFVLLLLLGQWKDALFGLAAVGNILIGVVQEYRAKRSLDRLAILNASLAAAVFAVNVYAMAVGGHTSNATRTASVLTLSLTGLWILAAISRPLNLRRVSIIGAMYISLAFVLTMPFLQDFFGLEWPPNDLLLAALGSALGGILAIEVLARLRNRRHTRNWPRTPQEAFSRLAP